MKIPIFKNFFFIFSEDLDFFQNWEKVSAPENTQKKSPEKTDILAWLKIFGFLIQ